MAVTIVLFIHEIYSFSFTLDEDGTLQGQGYDFGTAYGNLTVSQQLHIQGGQINLTGSKTKTIVELRSNERESIAFQTASGKKLLSLNTLDGVDTVNVNSGLTVSTENSAETVIAVNATAPTADIFVVNKDGSPALKVDKNGVVHISEQGIQQRAFLITPTNVGAQIPHSTSLVQVLSGQGNISSSSFGIRLPLVSPGLYIKIVNTDKQVFNLFAYNSNNVLNGGGNTKGVLESDLVVECLGISVTDWVCRTQDITGAGAMTRAGSKLTASNAEGFRISNTKGNIELDGADGELLFSARTKRMLASSSQFSFVFDGVNETAADFRAGDSSTMSFLKMDSFTKRLVVGPGNQINKTTFQTKTLDFSPQETNFLLRNDKFFALEITNGDRENSSFVRIDTKNNELLLGEGSAVSKTKFMSNILDVSSQNTEINIGANSSRSLDFVSGSSATSSYLRMGIDTISLGLGSGIEKTIIGTSNVNMKNVSSLEVSNFKITGSDPEATSYFEVNEDTESITLAKGSNVRQLFMNSRDVIFDKQATQFMVSANESHALEILQGVDADMGSFIRIDTGIKPSVILGEGTNVLETRIETKLVLNGESIESKKAINLESDHAKGVRVENVSFIDGKIVEPKIKDSLTVKKTGEANKNDNILSVGGIEEEYFTIRGNGDIKANTFVDGMKVSADGSTAALSVQVENLTTGSGLQVIGNTKLSEGKLVDLQTSSMYAQNPMSLQASKMMGGKAFRILTPSLTSGSALQVSSMDGNNLKKALSPVPVRVWKDGTVTVVPDLKPRLTHGEYVTLSNCTVASNLRELVLSVVQNVSKKSTCTEMIHLSSYAVQDYISADSLVLHLSEKDTFTENENVSLLGCEIAGNNGQYRIKNISNTTLVSTCMTNPIASHSSLDLLQDYKLVVESSFRDLFSTNDIVNLENCSKAWNNKKYVVINHTAPVYKAYDCLKSVSVMSKVLVDEVAASLSDGTLYVQANVKAQFQPTDKVGLSGCSNSSLNSDKAGPYKILSAGDNAFRVHQCIDSYCRNGICNMSMDCAACQLPI